MAPDDGALFDRVAEIYDRVRPSYPPALFEAIAAYGEPPFRALEVAPGTGQATAGLLPLCRELTCIERGPRMAEMLRRKFAGDDRLTVITGAFEQVELALGRFDLALCATAMHWLDAGTRMARFARALRPGGVLAVISTIQVAAAVDRGYFERSIAIYERYDAHTDEVAPAPESAVPQVLPEVEACGFFDEIELHRFRWDQRYETEQYLDLVRTYSTTLRMAHEAAEGLLGDLQELIEGEYEGYVVRPLVMALILGRRASAA